MGSRAVNNTNLFLDIPPCDGLELAIINHVNLKANSIPLCVYHKSCVNKYVLECRSFEQLQRIMYASAFSWKGASYSWKTGAGAELKGLAVEILVPEQTDFIKNQLSALGNVWQPMTSLGQEGLRARLCTLIVELRHDKSIPQNIVSADNQRLAVVYDVGKVKLCCVCNRFVDHGCQCQRPVPSSNLLTIE